MNPGTVAALRDGNCPKGDPIPVARTAGIMAAGDASRLIPYCHPVRIDHVEIDFELLDDSVSIRCTVTAVDRTGVEMEALTGVCVAGLTLYDMLKPMDDSLCLGETLIECKEGGRSDHAEEFGSILRGAVLVASDSVASGSGIDRSGVAIQQRLESHDIEVVEKAVVPDDSEDVEEALRRYVERGLDLVVTTGGTGPGPRDVTVEATASVIDRKLPGIAEAVRRHGFDRTPRAALSRGLAGVARHTLIINLPGSTRGAMESMDAIFPGVLHAVPMIHGKGHDE